MKIKAKDKFAWNQASWCGILLAAMLGTCIFSRPAYADCTPSGPFYSGATNGLSCGAMTNASTNMPALTQTQILESAGAVLVVPGSTNTPEFSDGTGHYTVTRDCPYSSSDVTNLITFQPGGPLWTQNWPTNNPPNPVQCGLPSNLTAPYSAIAYVVGYSSDTNVWQNIFYEVGPCVWDIATTNSVDGSITLSNNSATTIYGYGSQVSLTAASLVSNAVATVTIQSPPGLTNFSYTTNYPAPAVIAEWWTVSGPGTYTNTGSGLSAQFTPTNSVGGVGTATFYVAYQNTLPCTDTNFYTNSVAEGFTVVDILATANGTTVDLATNTPEFCVGQQVTFQLAGIGPNLNLVGTWNLPTNFVNEPFTNEQWVVTDPVTDNGYWQYGSVNYQIDSTLLQSTNQTSCWFVDGSGGQVLVGMNIQFNNGQNLTIAADGNFTVYRPIVTCPVAPTYMQTIIPVFANPWLELGNASQYGGDDVGTASFNAKIQSTNNFTGLANWTQLIERSVTLPFIGTGLGYDLDTQTLYNDNNSTVQSVNNHQPSAGVPIYDSPGVDTKYITWSITIQDDFNTFLVFKPDPQNSSIWVTLGCVTWGWGGTEANSVLTSPSTVQPSYTNSDQFPIWDSIHGL